MGSVVIGSTNSAHLATIGRVGAGSHLPATGGHTVLPDLSTFYAASNGSALPYNVVNSTNNVRHNLLPIKIAGTNYGRLSMTFLGYYIGDGYTVPMGYSKSIRVSVRQANGIWRQAFLKNGGASTGVVPDNGHVTMYVDGTFNNGDVCLACIRTVGPSGAVDYLVSHSSVAYRGGGLVQGTDSGVDLTDGAAIGFGATGTPNMVANAVNSVTINTPGSKYGAVGLIYFNANEAGGKDADYYAATDGSAVTGAGQNNAGSGFVTAPATYIQPGSSADTVIYGPAIISGVPSTSVKPVSMVGIGDSIMKGFSSSDQYGDANGNFGIYERAYNSAFGFVNFGIAGITAAGWITPLTKVLAAMDDNGITVNNAIIQPGINDVTLGTGLVALTSYRKAIAASFKARGAKIVHSDLMPSTTGTFVTDPASNQTPNTGAGAVGVRTNFNAALDVDPDLTGDYPAMRVAAVLCDPVNTHLWGAPNKTSDGAHPRGWNGADTPLAKSGTTYNFYPSRGIEYFVANYSKPTFTP